MQVFNKSRLPWGFDYRGRIMTIPADGQLHIIPDDVGMGQLGDLIQIVVPPAIKTEDREDVKKLLSVGASVAKPVEDVTPEPDGSNVVMINLDDVSKEKSEEKIQISEVEPKIDVETETKEKPKKVVKKSTRKSSKTTTKKAL